jgi:hypothetical protein
VPNQVRDANTAINVDFSIDNREYFASYTHNPSDTTDYEYNVTMYKQTGLKNIEHQLVMSPNPGSQDTIFLFDYAMYTYVWPTCTVFLLVLTAVQVR